MKQVGFALKFLAAPIFLSSFFVTDNKKAVKRRYIAVGLLVGGFVVEKVGPKLVKG